MRGSDWVAGFSCLLQSSLNYTPKAAITGVGRKTTCWGERSAGKGKQATCHVEPQNPCESAGPEAHLVTRGAGEEVAG